MPSPHNALSERIYVQLRSPPDLLLHETGMTDFGSFNLQLHTDLRSTDYSVICKKLLQNTKHSIVVVRKIPGLHRATTRRTCFFQPTGFPGASHLFFLEIKQSGINCSCGAARPGSGLSARDSGHAGTATLVASPGAVSNPCSPTCEGLERPEVQSRRKCTWLPQTKYYPYPDV